MWQRAIQLLVEVNPIISSIPTRERYDFGSQVRRAALSVSSSIAEGFGRDHLGDYLRFLSVSRGSVFEVESDLLALQALSLLPVGQLAPAIDSADQIGRMLTSQSRKLRARYRRTGRQGAAAFFDFDGPRT